MQAGDIAALDALSSYYDLRHDSAGADVAFYAGLAEESAGPILEAGCGTGRLLLPLAEAGREVIGVDVSRQMLEHARRRMAGLGGATGVSLVQADLLRLPAGGVGLAVLALNTLCHFASLDRQQAALAAVRRSLIDGGVVALDVPNPLLDLDSRPDGVPALEAVHEVDGGSIYEWSVVESDAATQTLSVRLIWDTCEAGGTVRRQSRAYVLRLPYRSELELLLRAAGFRDVRVYGDFDCSQYRGDSPRIVALAST